MSHILNISTHYIKSKSYICIPEMIRNSEKLMNLNFEIGNCGLITLMMVIKDSLKFVNTIDFRIIPDREIKNIIDFYSKMEYPVDIRFPDFSRLDYPFIRCLGFTDSEYLLEKIVKMPKRLVQKELSMYFTRFNSINLEAVSSLKPTIIDLFLFENYEVREFLEILKGTRIKEIFLDHSGDPSEEISFDFTKYPKLENFISHSRRGKKLKIIEPQEPFASLVREINVEVFSNFPDNLSFPYLEKLVVTSRDINTKIVENKLFPREIYFGNPFTSFEIGIWPSIEIVSFNLQFPSKFDYNCFPNLQKIIVRGSNPYDSDVPKDVPKSVEICGY